MKYDVYAKNTPLILGVLTDKGVPYNDTSEAFKCLISQIARGMQDESKITIVRREMMKDSWGKSLGFLNPHWRVRARLSDLMGYRIHKTPKQVEEITRIVKGLYTKQKFSVAKIVNETKLTKPQVRHILGFDRSVT